MSERCVQDIIGSLSVLSVLGVLKCIMKKLITSEVILDILLSLIFGGKGSTLFGCCFCFIQKKAGEVLPKLTEKQKRFCEEYLIDFNATQAALRAGYSQKTAYSIGDENLRKPEIQSEIQTLIRKRSERTGINADIVIKELVKIALADTEITGKEKIKALELLGKHLGLFDNCKADESKILEKLDEVLGGIKSEF